MRTGKESERKVKRKTGTKIVGWLLVSAFFAIVLLVLLAPVLASSGSGRRIVLAKINKSVAGRTDFADLSVGWLKGVKVSDFSFNGHAGQLSVQAKQITTKPHYASILTGGLSFGETIVNKPRVHVSLDDAYMAKVRQHKTSGDKEVQAMVLPIQTIDLVVQEGSFKVTDQNAKTAELSQINSKVSLRPPGQQTSFALTAAVSSKDLRSTVSVY